MIVVVTGIVIGLAIIAFALALLQFQLQQSLGTTAWVLSWPALLVVTGLLLAVNLVATILPTLLNPNQARLLAAS